ncbi:glutamate racemase [Undibacterium sp. Xuan67W]|uniref:glutamate racemase n=1 Tax=Undibacterium sp. Xuan67W TaxID=3413057 RepID=UPI003BF3EF06
MQVTEYGAVGVFDSGIGGLSVLQHIRHRLPDESLIYFADSGFAPYGDKSELFIIERSLLIADYLHKKNCKAIVVACNTATAAAIKTLRDAYPDMIIVGVEPGLKPAIQLSKNHTVGVLATQSTLQSTKFQTLKNQLSADTDVRFLSQACIGLVDQIEKNELHTEDTLALLHSYITPLLEQGVDTLVLGCTHYPFLTDAIKQIVTNSGAAPIQIIDTGEAVARQLEKLLSAAPATKKVPHPYWVKAPQPFFSIYTTGQLLSAERAVQGLLKLAPEGYQIFFASEVTPQT